MGDWYTGLGTQKTCFEFSFLVVFQQKEAEAKEETSMKKFSFKYIIDHGDVCFFLYVNSLNCFMGFLLYYLLNLFRSDHFTAFTNL